jgi:adenylate cyclase
MSSDPAQSNPFWQAVFSGEHPELRRGRRVLRLMSATASERCRLCYAGFDGFAAPLMRALGRAQWRRNPHFCEKCEGVLAEQRGGAESDMAVLYADVRGSTQLAAHIPPAEFAALMQRFFDAAVAVFAWTDGIVDKMVGDEVIALYVPSIAGPDYRRLAVAAGLRLLRATGNAGEANRWLPIGVGVHAGTAFIGSIGSESGNYQFAALGDAMNYGARLVAAAREGELVMSEAVWRAVSGEVPAEARQYDLKGYAEPQTAYVARA